MSPRQIISSIARFLQTKLKDSAELYIDGVDILNESTYPRFEIRIDGPNITSTTKNFRIFEIEIFIMVITKSSVNRLIHYDLIEVCRGALPNTIPILNDNDVVVDCFQSADEIYITPYGTVSISDDITQTSVERKFTLHTGA